MAWLVVESKVEWRAESVCWIRLVASRFARDKVVEETFEVGLRLDG